jgi:hypothetical protein
VNVELRPIDSIRPYEPDPRVNDAAVEAVAASIRQFRFRQPVVVDEQGVIIVGHTRWKAAKKAEVLEWRTRDTCYLASSNFPRAVLGKRASLPLVAISRVMAAFA